MENLIYCGLIVDEEVRQCPIEDPEKAQEAVNWLLSGLYAEGHGGSSLIRSKHIPNGDLEVWAGVISRLGQMSIHVLHTSPDGQITRQR